MVTEKISGRWSVPASRLRNDFCARAFMALILGYPLLVLLVQGAMNTIFALTVFLTISVLVKASRSGGVDVELGEWTYSVAMGLLPLAIFLSDAYHSAFTAPAYDAASRFLLSGLLFIGFRRLDRAVLLQASPGFALGTFAALAAMLWFPGAPGPRADTYFLDPIHFGDTALILGTLSGATIDWAAKDRLWVRALKGIALVLGVYLSIRSGSRGGWVAMPVLFGAWYYLASKRLTARQRAMVFVTVLAVGALAYVFDAQLQQRVIDVWRNLVGYQKGRIDTAVGVRFKLWEAGLVLWWHNLWFGIGPRGMKMVMVPMSEFGLAAPIIAAWARAEMHNDILASTTALGLPGLIAILAVYLAPLWVCARALKSRDSLRRKAGVAGILFVLGFAVFGLTVEVFDLSMMTAFYSMTSALLCALAAGPKTSEDDARRPG